MEGRAHLIRASEELTPAVIERQKHELRMHNKGIERSRRLAVHAGR